MRTLNPALALALGLVLLAATAGAAQSEREAREECSAHSGAGLRDCLARKAAASAERLAQAQGDTLRAIGSWDEDARYRAAAGTRLERANNAFIAYRDAQCAFRASLGGGAIGAALETLQLACAQELDALRAEQLEAALAGLPKK